MELKHASPNARPPKIARWARNTAIVIATVAVLAFGGRALANEPNMASQQGDGKANSGEVHKAQDKKATVSEWRTKGVVDNSTVSGICIQAVAQRLGMGAQEALGALYGSPQTRKAMERMVAGVMGDNGVKNAKKLRVGAEITVSGERVDTAVSQIRAALGTQGSGAGTSVTFTMPAGADSCLDGGQLVVPITPKQAPDTSNAAHAKPEVAKRDTQPAQASQPEIVQPSGNSVRGWGFRLDGNMKMLLGIIGLGALWGWLELRAKHYGELGDAMSIGPYILSSDRRSAESEFERNHQTDEGRLRQMGINFIRSNFVERNWPEFTLGGNGKDSNSVILEHVSNVGDKELYFLMSKLARNMFEGGKVTYYDLAYALQEKAKGLAGTSEMGKKIDKLVEEKLVSMNGKVEKIEEAVLAAEREVLKGLIEERLRNIERNGPDPDGSGGRSTSAVELGVENRTGILTEAVVGDGSGASGLLLDRFSIGGIPKARMQEFKDLIGAASELRTEAKRGDKKVVYEMVREEVLAKFGMRISDATILKYARKFGQKPVESKVQIVEFAPENELPLAA